MAPTARENRTAVFSLEPEYPSETKKKYCRMKFDRETKRDVNHYQMKTAIENQIK